jgi:DNA modification methylase
VWTISPEKFMDAHYAVMPNAIAEICIKAGCPAGGTVLDPFGGAGTTALVADRLQRNSILIELNPDYAAMAERRTTMAGGMFASVTLQRTE